MFLLYISLFISISFFIMSNISYDNKENHWFNKSEQNLWTKTKNFIDNTKKAVRNVITATWVALSAWWVTAPTVVPASIETIATVSTWISAAKTITLWTAAALAATACQKEDTIAPNITLNQHEVDITWWKQLRINWNQLYIWNDLIASWIDDVSDICNVTLSFNGKAITSWTTLSESWTLTITVTDWAWNKKTTTVKLNVTNNAPSINLKTSEVNTFWWVSVNISNNQLSIWWNLIASWSDDRTSNCTVSLKFNNNEVKSWDTLNWEWKLILTITDGEWKSSSVEITLTNSAISWLENLKQASMQVNQEINLLQWLSFADWVTLEKVEILIDWVKNTVSDPNHFTPEYPWTCSIIFSVKKNNNTYEVSVDWLNIKALEYSPMQINNLKPQDILPIVWQVEVWDTHAYEHIEHLRIAEATRVRDMMWKYWAWNYTAEEYQELMMRLNTWMLWENPIWYDNYEIVGGELADSPSEHANAEWGILNTIINHANFKIIDSYEDNIKELYELSNDNSTSINIFWLSKSADIYSKKNYRDMSDRKQHLQKSNLLVFWSWWNIKYSSSIIKNKIYQEDFDLPDEHSVYTWQSCANSKNDAYIDRHLILTFWTNPNWNTNITNYTWWSKFPVWFNNDILFAWRAFPYKNIDWKIYGQTGSSWYFEDSWYASSYPNYVNVAITDLCFQMFAEIKDIDELLDMIKSTSLKDYTRYDDMTQELHLINPAWFIKEYLMPKDLPLEISSWDIIDLNKGYYKWIIFDIPWAEVNINWNWIPYNEENKSLIKQQNPFNLEWRLNWDLCKKLWYNKNNNNIKWNIIIIDEKYNGLNISNNINITFK